MAKFRNLNLKLVKIHKLNKNLTITQKLNEKIIKITQKSHSHPQFLIPKKSSIYFVDNFTHFNQTMHPSSALKGFNFK